MAAAVAAGIPLGVACHRAPRARAAVLNLLNVIQTIPSIALFGLLIAPLGWLAANVPAAAALGIRGIGVAPAVVALFLYSLLPVVANTVAGLASVPAAVREAARGMGMTGGQRLMRVELPLALPVMLTAIRIVLVQNIGLATVAALIGGGGFGVFVFQGIGQMAMDLVLLGALPTVLLAFASAIVLDALVESLSVPARNGDAA
jgi:osmoprotectant transport system permease protein